MGNLKKGDRIRLTLEADVLYGSSFGVDLAVPAVAGGQFTIREREFSDVEFEKVEPPVEVFKPGDVVRIEETRPISKTKTWRVLDQVQAGKGQAVEADLEVEAAGASSNT